MQLNMKNTEWCDRKEHYNPDLISLEQIRLIFFLTLSYDTPQLIVSKYRLVKRLVTKIYASGVCSSWQYVMSCMPVTSYTKSTQKYSSWLQFMETCLQLVKSYQIIPKHPTKVLVNFNSNYYQMVVNSEDFIFSSVSAEKYVECREALEKISTHTSFNASDSWHREHNLT